MGSRVSGQHAGGEERWGLEELVELIEGRTDGGYRIWLTRWKGGRTGIRGAG